MDIPQFKSPAKQKLVDMLVELKDKDEGDYTFYLNGDTEDATRFVHRMRVELSRFRKANERRGRSNNPFKILIVEIAKHSEEKTKVVLRKQTQASGKIMEELSEVFDLIDGGQKIG